jgi:hypothetical protein
MGCEVLPLTMKGKSKLNVREEGELGSLLESKEDEVTNT